MSEPARKTSLPESFYAALFRSSTDAIITKDLNGIITSVNPAAERLFGYPAAEMIGQSVLMLFPPDRRDEEPVILGRIARGEMVEHFETVRRRKDGTLLDISLNVSPVRDEAGRILGASKIARDITESKRLQERTRVTLSSIADAVIATDTLGNVTFLNSAAEHLTGWVAAEARGRPLAEVFNIINESTRQKAENPAAQVLARGVTVGLANHTALIAKDGTERLIDDSAAPIRSSTGEVVGVVLVFRDVSDRRTAEFAAFRLAAIVEGSDDAIVGKTLQGIVTSWNPGAEKLFGYTAAEMIGQSITRLLPPDRLNEEQHILARLQRGEKVEHFETPRVRKDGSIVYVSLTISPIRDRTGIIIGASKIARDITMLKRAQERLQAHALELELKVRERTAKLEETVAELEAFSYSLSHDMRAPIRAIESFVEIVLTDYGAKIPEGVEYLQKAVNAAARMDRLIQDVLAFTRLSRSEIKLGPVDVEKLLQDIIHERPELQQPHASVILRGPLPRVVGHDALLTQCFTNLLHNAVKFVLPGVKPVVEIFGEAAGGKVRLSVRDNGIGIDRVGQERLFAIFQRLPTPHQYHGTGIGLAIVRKAAERMNGTVGVTSMPGQGSTFWIELPKDA